MVTTWVAVFAVPAGNTQVNGKHIGELLSHHNGQYYAAMTNFLWERDECWSRCRGCWTDRPSAESDDRPERLASSRMLYLRGMVWNHAALLACVTLWRLGSSETAVSFYIDDILDRPGAYLDHHGIRHEAKIAGIGAA